MSTAGAAEQQGAVRSGEAQRLAVLGAPIDVGASQPGAIMGPAALRVAGLIESLRELGHDVADLGDLPVPDPIALDASLLSDRSRNLPLVAGWSRALSDAVYEVMRAGRRPIVLGGDHSLTMGSANAVARYARSIGRELFVLWLDAHADFNTPRTTPSGNMHGMSAALLAGEAGLEAVFGAEPRATIPPRNLALFGIRSIDAGERALLKARGVDVYDMRAIDEFGVGVLLRRVLDKVAAADGLLHVSFDVDFLDPSIAPGVGTTVPGGATFREAHLVMELLHDSGRVSSVDVVELNPFLDVRGRSAFLLVDLIDGLFGRQIIERETEPDRSG